MTLQHEEIINKSGEVRRAAKRNDALAAQTFALELAELMDPHTALEEDGLFAALMSDEEYVEPLEKLTMEHREIDGLIGQIIWGDISLADHLDTLLRNHIGNEENGIFPASAVTLDGWVWDEIERTSPLTPLA